MSRYIALKQTFAKEGKQAQIKSGRYAHAKQFVRMQRQIKRQRTIVGILLREIDRKKEGGITGKLADIMAKARRIKEQKRNDKKKLYALHAPEVECIGKGKARNPFEFGVKTIVATTRKHSLIVGTRTFLWVTLRWTYFECRNGTGNGFVARAECYPQSRDCR